MRQRITGVAVALLCLAASAPPGWTRDAGAADRGFTVRYADPPPAGRLPATAGRDRPARYRLPVTLGLHSPARPLGWDDLDVKVIGPARDGVSGVAGKTGGHLIHPAGSSHACPDLVLTIAAAEAGSGLQWLAGGGLLALAGGLALLARRQDRR